MMNKVSAFRRSLKTFLLLACFVVGSATLHADDDEPFDQIIRNITQQELADANIKSACTNAAAYLKQIRADGSFPDIDYASKAQTDWPAIGHLDRLKPMIIAYVDTTSTMCGDSALYTGILNALNYWHAANPTSTNWFMWEIGWPQRMGVCLTLMRSGKQQVPADVESKILNRMKSLSKGPDQPGSQGTGANKMDIALQWIYRTCLQRDKANLDFAIKQFYLPMTFNAGEGLQSDYSYLQHGPQLYIGGYGGSVLSAVFKVAFYVVGTEYSGGETMNLISNFVRLGYMPAVRGRYMMYSAIGRGMARRNGTDRRGFSGSLQKMQVLDPDYADRYQYDIERLRGNRGHEYGLTPFHRHYWRGDYTIHQRPEYTVDVRMASTRTYRCENGNGENLKGYFLTEGGTSVVRRGDEYVDIFPVWDWTRIPGTTTPVVSKVPQPAQWGQYGQSTFTGGVSDSIYGVTAYHMVDNKNGINTSGRKAWFFFDREVVCLGSDIRSSNASPINTTINQCLQHGNVEWQSLGADRPDTLIAGERRVTDIEWLHHDSVAYYFPGGSDLNVRADNQSGTWSSIVSGESTSTVTKRVFKTWLDHGVKPAGAKYAYCILPATSSVADARTRLDSLVMTNTDTLQAVYNPTAGVVGAVFHRRGTMTLGDVEVSVTAPCVVMFTRTASDSVLVSVADPSGETDSLTLYAKFPALSYKALGVRFDRSVHYAGATRNYVIDAATADSVYIPVESVEMSRRTLTLGYDTPRAELAVRVAPANATCHDVTWTSTNPAVATVGDNGYVQMRGRGEARIIATSVDGATDECLVTITDSVLNDGALADAYVYDGSKGSNYGAAQTVVVRTDGTGYNRVGYYRFPLTAVKDVDVTAYNLKAKIVLYVKSGAQNAAEVIWRVKPVRSLVWAENALTWNNMPAADATILDQQRCFIPSDEFSVKNFVEFDITSYVLSQVERGQTSISLKIDQDARASAGKGTTEFSAKEATDSRLHPAIYFLVSPDPVGVHPDVTAETRQPVIIGSRLYARQEAGTTARLYNPAGRLLRTFEGDGSTDISALPRGIYIVHAGAHSYKIMK